MHFVLKRYISADVHLLHTITVLTRVSVGVTCTLLESVPLDSANCTTGSYTVLVFILALRTSSLGSPEGRLDHWWPIMLSLAIQRIA